MQNQKLKANPILGFSDRRTIKLDFDEMKFKIVTNLAMFAFEKYKLEGFIVLKSSKNSYHVIFDRYAESWAENMSIIAWTAILSKRVSLLRYLAMQCIKMSSTLRISNKGKKPTPRIVFRYGSQNHAIKDFLAYRQLIMRIYC